MNEKEIMDKAVAAIMLNFGQLAETSPVAAYEAVMIARNPDHEPFGNTGDILRKTGLLDNTGVMHSLVRDTLKEIVL